jgi:hypothetical protein
MNFRTFFLPIGWVSMASVGLVGQSFKGTVSDSLDRPLPSARVVWLLSAGGIGGGHYTDSLGRFSFT